MHMLLLECKHVACSHAQLLLHAFTLIACMHADLDVHMYAHERVHVWVHASGGYTKHVAPRGNCVQHLLRAPHMLMIL